MTLFPVVERELRAASRRSATYWSRFQAALAATLPAAFLLATPLPFASPALGPQMFQVLAYLSLVSGMIAAARLTADCLSSEKREGTLGFLFLTDLKPQDVVFGKLAATSFNAFYGLLALVPVLALPLLCGGVTLWDVFRLALVLVNSLFFALALAMFVSALSWRERSAVGMAILILFAVAAGFPLSSAALSPPGAVSGLAWILKVSSPTFACGAVAGPSYAAHAGDFWTSIFVTHAFGWLFLLLTSLVLPHVWQDRPAQGRLRRWREFCRRALLGNAPLRVAFRRSLLEKNPIYWLASRERRAVWYPWIFLASMTVVFLFVAWILRFKSVDFGPLFFVSFFFNWFFKHWTINVACPAFSTDRDKGALELLLSTPLRIDSVLAGHWQALRRQFLAPIAVLLGMEFICFAFALTTFNDQSPSSEGFYLAAFLIGQLVFCFDLVALVWVGWWSGVISRNASGAVSSTYFRIMILPWLLTVLGLIPIVRMIDLTEWLLITALIFWAATGLWADLFFAHRARRQLLTELRSAASERYSGDTRKKAWWRPQAAQPPPPGTAPDRSPGQFNSPTLARGRSTIK